MCGIAGVLGQPNHQLLERMVAVQAHRGPDDHGVTLLPEDGIGLGHRRLSIIDLSPAGHQPMSNLQRNIWITYNGEIYNYREIREELRQLGHQFRSETDTEVLLAAYEQWGFACLEKLNGMFAFAIWDGRKKRLFAARDRVGIKPFYYTNQGGSFAFASEIKALFECPFVDKAPDFNALRTPARFQVPPYTGFQDILKLPAAHYLVVEQGNIRIERYWAPTISENPLSDGEVLEELDALIRDAVRLQMVGDVPVGAFLSGGLDSSLVSALMRQHTSQDLHAFTIRFSEGDQKREAMPDDSYYARKVADTLGFKYHEFEIEPDIESLLPKMIWHMDEPLSDPAAINTYLMSLSARENGIVVLLNGMGADEIFGGYRKHLACLYAARYQRFVPSPARHLIERGVAQLPVATSSRGLRTARWAKRFFSFASLPPLDRYLASDLALSKSMFEDLVVGGDYQNSVYYQANQKVFESAEASLLTRMCLNDTSFFLPDHNLTYTDKSTMAASLESRPPLTDHRIIEYAFSLPPRFRVRGSTQKYALKKIGERYLEQDVVYRPKAPFAAPLRSWIRGALAPMIGDTLMGSNLQTRELYNPKEVERIIEADRKGLEDHSLVIWSILTTELWYRMHFGKN